MALFCSNSSKIENPCNIYESVCVSNKLSPNTLKLYHTVHFKVKLLTYLWMLWSYLSFKNILSTGQVVLFLFCKWESWGSEFMSLATETRLASRSFGFQSSLLPHHTYWITQSLVNAKWGLTFMVNIMFDLQGKNGVG